MQAPHRSAKLLEREALLSAAAQAIAGAQRGEGCTLLVTGEAGVGKTALLQQIVHDLDGAQRVWWGHCEDLFSPRPLGPLRDIAAAQCGALSRLIDGSAPAAAVFAAFLDLLGTRGPGTVVVFEDLHWADEATLDLVRFIARRIGRRPVALILSYRDEDAGRGHALRQIVGDMAAQRVVRLVVPPLSPAAVATLAEMAGYRASGLHELTGGNCFFVTEVLASRAPGPERSLPASVRDAVQTRLGRLASGPRAVLDVLCLIPGRVELWLVRKLLSADRFDSLDDCIARGLLVSDDGALWFRHELARLATADALAPMRRQASHAQVLAALSSPPPGVPAPALSRRVHHAAEAGDALQVMALAPAAALEASAVGGHREAAQQLAAALRFVDWAAPEKQALLYEHWSYEAGLSMIDQEVVDARHRAIALWRKLGRLDKVGHNLRWLSRLAWYRGDSELAGRFADEAVATLAPLPPGPELAWAYSVRAQQHMLQERTQEAVEWGERAIALAQALDAQEILCHALNTVGTAELFAQRDGGQARLARSLEISLAHGFHEQTARVYTNSAEHAVVFRRYDLAETLLRDGIAFDREYDLDAWTHYLEGWLAQLRLEQGRLDDAIKIALAVLAIPHLTAVMRLPALTVLGRARTRRGDAEALSCLHDALDIALATAESQRIVPIVLGMVEEAWLRHDIDACRAALARLDGLDGVYANAWQAGEVAVWRQRAGVAEQSGTDALLGPVGDPWQRELDGDPAGAAVAWQAIGAPHEAALAALQAAAMQPSEHAAAALAQALQIFDNLRARPGAARARAIARELGLRQALPKPARGPYAAARAHPHGLTPREQQTLALIAQGMRNADIARHLGLAERTVEHHVTAILAKLSVNDRIGAVQLAQREGWLEPR